MRVKLTTILPNFLLLFMPLLMAFLNGKSQTPNISISLPNPLPSNTSSWGTGGNNFIISVSGSHMDLLNESNMLVNIKSGDAIVCGGTTATQNSGIYFSSTNTTGSKSWVGSNAQALLGQDCELVPGSYEICVEFVGNYNGEHLSLLKKCIPFIIQDKKDIPCSNPVNIKPTDKKEFTGKDITGPVTFNWSPFIKPGTTNIHYHLMVWEVEDGQNNLQAIYSNPLLIDQTITGITHYTALPGIFENRSATYVWRVEAVDEEGRVLCDNAKSEPTNFSVIVPEKTTPATTGTKDSCCQSIINATSQNITVSGSTITLKQSFSISPVNIKKVSVEIIGAEETVMDTACMQCDPHDKWSYQFISPNTTSWNSTTPLIATPVNSAGYYPAKMIQWLCNKQGTIDFKLTIALPGKKAGCTRKGKICFRYRFEDIDCKTCERVICYDYTAL